ncbi:MAG: hypothetical protein ABEJ69_03835 [Candidatus Nanohaloarchaea archaeon]
MKETAFLVVLSLLFLVPAVSAAGMDLMSLQDSSLDKGEVVTVELRAEGENIAGYSAEIVFSGAMLAYLDASGTPSFSDPVVNSQENRIILTSAEATGTDDPVLARLSFKVVNESQDHAALNITDAYLNTPSREIERVEVSGEILNISASAVSETNRSADYPVKVVEAWKNVSVQRIREMSGVSVESVYRGEEVLIQVKVSTSAIKELERLDGVKNVRAPAPNRPDEPDREREPSRNIIEKVIGFLSNLFSF